MADHTKYGGAADGMESPMPSFSVAVEFSYSDEAGKRVSEEILLPVNRAALRALDEKAGDSGFLGGEARLIHNPEDASEPGEDIVSFAVDSYYSLDDLNGYAERINRLAVGSPPMLQTRRAGLYVYRLAAASVHDGRATVGGLDMARRAGLG